MLVACCNRRGFSAEKRIPSGTPVLQSSPLGDDCFSFVRKNAGIRKAALGSMLVACCNRRGFSAEKRIPSGTPVLQSSFEERWVCFKHLLKRGADANLHRLTCYMIKNKTILFVKVYSFTSFILRPQNTTVAPDIANVSTSGQS